MSDLSTSEPMVKWSEEWWANAKPEVQARRCKAHRKNGDRCKRAALNFQRVCSHHGGKARQSVESARRRMLEQADPAVKQLSKIAFDETAPIETRLKATLAIIDRTGLGPRAIVEVGPRAPYEDIIDGIIEMESGGSRAAHRGESITEAINPTPGLADQAALPPADDEPLDAEIIDAEPITSDDDERGLAGNSAPEFNPFAPTMPPPEAGLMTLESAVSAAAEIRRNVVLRRAQRALPPGRSM